MNYEFFINKENENLSAADMIMLCAKVKVSVSILAKLAKLQL